MRSEYTQNYPDGSVVTPTAPRHTDTLKPASDQQQPQPQSLGLQAATPCRAESVEDLLPSRANASLTSSIFNLANTIMGSGLLTLPSAFASCGLTSGIAMAIVAALFNILTLHILSEAAKARVMPPRATLGVVAELALPGWGGLCIDLAVGLYGFGVCIGYLIVATDSLVDVTGYSARWVWTLAAAAIVTPLTLLRSLDSLRFTSTLAIISLCAAALVTAVHWVAHTSLHVCGGFTDGTVMCHPEASTQMACPGHVDPFVRPLLPTLTAFSKFVLAFGELPRACAARTFDCTLTRAWAVARPLGHTSRRLAPH